MFANAGLDSVPTLVAGGAFFTFLGGFAALLVNALIKTGARADRINDSLVDEKNTELAALRAQIAAEREQWDRDRRALTEERDSWFKLYDKCRAEQRKKDGE